MKDRIFFSHRATHEMYDLGSENSVCCFNIFYIYKIECNFVIRK